MSKRKVKIVPVYLRSGKLDTWSVRYVERQKGCRYSAAGFQVSVKTLAQVVEWIKSNPKLELDETAPMPVEPSTP